LAFPFDVPLFPGLVFWVQSKALLAADLFESLVLEALFPSLHGFSLSLLGFFPFFSPRMKVFPSLLSYGVSGCRFGSFSKSAS